jgi:predicted phosphoadenosine phosphosulfate sulfurtransferase
MFLMLRESVSRGHSTTSSESMSVTLAARIQQSCSILKRDTKVGCFFLDWECQLSLTIDSAREMFALYRNYIIPYWVAVPICTWNSCSQIEPEWIAWDPSKRDLWVRQPEPISITNGNFFDFYTPNMLFEEFVPLFGQWFANGKRCAAFVGIRTQESLNRFRTVARQKDKFDDKAYSTLVVDDCWNVYPIYDWKTEDVWTYLGKFNQTYNKLYDRMYQAGMTIHQMRICEPFGDTSRQGLWLYQIVEPAMWAKMTLRVAGANMGALYASEKGSVLGNHSIALPEGHTFKSFANHLLDTMPPKTSLHYKNKIAVYLHWWSKRGYPDEIPDSVERKIEATGKVPSWRRICKTMLRNDYWCRMMGFSPTKTTAYQKYMVLMKRRRQEWGIFGEAA